MKRTLQMLMGLVIGLCMTFTVVEKSFTQGATVHIDKEGEFKLGIRTQFRYSYKEPNNSNDFMIRRTRLKAEGSIFDGTKFKVEYKLDDVGQEGKNPHAQAEDFSFFINDIFPNVNVRIGLFDAPLSRDQLTSDSKLLFIDYSDLVEDGYKSEGLADNVIGVSFYGFIGNHVEYHGGFFDNEKWDKESKQIMPMGRLVFHLLDMEKGEYSAAYPGGDKNHLNAGVSFGKLGQIKIGNETYDAQAVEADIFLFLSSGFSFQGEYGRINRSGLGNGLPGDDDLNSGGWFVQSGYILPSDAGNGKLQFAYSLQEFNSNLDILDMAITKHSIGINYYLLEHNLKIQSDFTRSSFKNSDSKNAFQLQLQVDF